MRRGEVWWVNFTPSIGGEIQKTRPAVIVSNNSSNNSLNRIQVVPLSGKTEKLYPSETLVIIESKANKAMADQLTTVSKTRLFQHAGVLSEQDMQKVEEVIKMQLGLR